MAKIALIILAAGKSTRFPGNKLLKRVNGETLIEKVVSRGLESKADAVFVVLGHESAEIEKVLGKLRTPKLYIVYNPEYEKGLSYSVKTGIRAAAEWGAEAFMILPADVAFIEARDINLVVEKYLETGSSIVVATHRGRHGHPILFSRRLLGELLEIREETYGLKSVVSSHRNEVVEVEGSEFTVRDIDTEQDLMEVLEMAKELKDA